MLIINFFIKFLIFLFLILIVTPLAGYVYLFVCNRIHIVEKNETCQSIFIKYKIKNIFVFFINNYKLDCDLLKPGKTGICVDTGEHTNWYK